VSGDPLAAQPPAADDRPARAAGGSPARPTARDAGRPRRAVERTAIPEEDGADVADLMVARIKSYGVHGERQGRSPS
jgi:hypothetical protein